MTLPFPDITAISECVLDGVRFTTDPGQDGPLTWEKDATVFKGQNSKTIQDFGIVPGQVKLGSTESTPLDSTTMLALHAKYRQAVTSAGLRYTDAFGNDFQVFVLEFTPTYREAGLWDYSMVLEILSITALLGAAYTG